MLPCEAGLVNFFVDPYGEVYPCNGLEEKYWQESMGNIRNVTDFKEIWGKRTGCTGKRISTQMSKKIAGWSNT